MTTKTAHIAQLSIRIFLMIFWLYVAIDKLWNLSAFHSALIKQSFPDWWADILFWLLPLIELVIAFLFTINHQSNSRHSEERSDVGIWNSPTRFPYILSASLLIIFSIYIALGLVGLYAERPCGCASIFSGISWKMHLLLNLALVCLSLSGWYLTGPTAPMSQHSIRYKRACILFIPYRTIVRPRLYQYYMKHVKRFKMRFALFPTGPTAGRHPSEAIARPIHLVKAMYRSNNKFKLEFFGGRFLLL